jgi:cytochrome P450/NADPH-cytochrome P450 reductase
MLDQAFEKLPNAAWKPFGNGMRGCIGRPFAWQEAILVTALLLQNFNLQLDDPNYQLQIKQTLTIKPKDFYMRAILRDGVDATYLEKALAGDAGATKTKQQVVKKEVGTVKKSKKLMSIFYGSNTGTCEALAQRLSTNAAAHGFDAAVAPLDSATQKLPKDRPVVIITASFEGQPPDNAAHFVEWLQSLSGDEAAGTNFAVFGCGHKDWRTTFHRIPNIVDDLLAARGGTRIAERGLADASLGEIFTEFDNWEDGTFWPAVTARFGGTTPSDSDASSSTVTVEISSQTRSTNLRMDVRNARVKSVRTLTAEGQKEKRHIEIELPSDMPYRAGDYLAVLPVNPKEDVKRVMKRFQLPWDAQLKISSDAPTVLPTNSDISAHAVLDAYVELSQPATKKNVLSFAAAAEDPAIKAELEALAGDQFQQEITTKRTSPLDLLERYPTLNLPLGDFLAMLPPMRVRQYSISSSPLNSAETCTVTYARLEDTAFSGKRRHLGVATSYLSSLEAGDVLQISVRASAKPFHLPLNPETTPIIMVCAGTGLAPFRGFVQERAVQIAAGRKLAKALLFVGCRYHDKDRLYADDFDAWEKMGAVELRYAFSRESERSLGCKYVQDRMRAAEDELHEAWANDAKVYVCGSAKVGEAVSEVCKELYRNKTRELGKEKTEEQVEEWFWALRNERFATDVFD